MRYYVYVLLDRAGAFAHVENGPLPEGKGWLVGTFTEVQQAVDCWEDLTAGLRGASNSAADCPACTVG